ncbi:MAG: carbamoyltransferase C-terminal domain-containing protein [Patescibacteria group bacterium]|nr:hypothetical protein [Patescibacteria group bacterium]
MPNTILGINICKTRAGINLNDGACAMLEDGKFIVAIAEERLSRKKYDGNIRKSFEYCLKVGKKRLEEIDYFVFSNCCDEPLDKKYLKSILEENSLNIPDKKIIINKSHHLSHAYSAFFASPFDEALILVADNEGNILDKKSKHYWLNSLERTSFYYAKGKKIKLLKRYHDGHGELGLAANYNYFTQCIGYNSYQEAGKTMALSSYGKGKFDNVEIYTKRDKSVLKSRLYLFEQIDSVRDLILKKCNIDVYKNKASIRRPSSYQKDLARLIQEKTEYEVIKLITKMLQKTKTRNLCIAGGLGLNCVANYKILKETGIKNIFIQPAAGDTGQCLGNAYYGYFNKFKNSEKSKEAYNTYLGKRYSKKEIHKCISKYKDKIKVKEIKNIPAKIAKLLAESKIVSIFQEGSEFGPRALGNRSILMDPRDMKAKIRLNKVKNREYYRPYAPVVMRKHVGEYFEYDKDSNFMLLAMPVLKDKRKVIPSVVHKDGTARVQTITEEQNSRYYNILREFKEITGVPVVLNTSFNRAGEPLVESPEDAINCFLNSEIDFMAINNYLLSKK